LLARQSWFPGFLVAWFPGLGRLTPEEASQVVQLASMARIEHQRIHMHAGHVLGCPSAGGQRTGLLLPPLRSRKGLASVPKQAARKSHHQ
jgi:hypothetical protein